MSIVAIIPARGGSKGIPGKNKKLFGGIPLIAHTINAAKQSGFVDEIFVSSDDPEILAIATNFGAEGIKRPVDLSSDTASSEAALLHCLSTLDAEDRNIEFVVFLQCTSPFTTSEQIDQVITACKNEGVQSAFSAVEDHGFLWSTDETGIAQGINHDSSQQRVRRQDLPPQYRENGAVYVMDAEVFRRDKHRFCGNTVVVPIDGQAIEIDTQNDWIIAENLYHSTKASNPKTGISALKAVIMDFDGVHTDNRVIINQDGTESVICDRGDGFGLEMLRKQNMRLLILSKEQNTVVAKRAEKLKIEVIHGVDDKVSVLENWLKEQKLTWPEIAYIGNDLNDIGCIEKSGMGFCPSDSHSKVKERSDVILSREGGKGAIREMSEILLRG